LLALLLLILGLVLPAKALVNQINEDAQGDIGQLAEGYEVAAL